jgi:acyl-CoA reductase-like NAD-dependent aldehyde dehydrogenase
LAPTVVAEPDPGSDLVVEEAFGAVVAVLRYESFDEVIDICNKSRYGLQTGLFTQNIARVFDAWRRLEVGGLIVNGTSNFRLDHVPFGGVKDSGIGRESPRWMIDDYTVTKTLILRGMSIWGDESASGM